MYGQLYIHIYIYMMALLLHRYVHAINVLVETMMFPNFPFSFVDRVSYDLPCLVALAAWYNRGVFFIWLDCCKLLRFELQMHYIDWITCSFQNPNANLLKFSTLIVCLCFCPWVSRHNNKHIPSWRDLAPVLSAWCRSKLHSIGNLQVATWPWNWFWEPRTCWEGKKRQCGMFSRSWLAYGGRSGSQVSCRCFSWRVAPSLDGSLI